MPFRLELNLDVAARYNRGLISVVNAHMVFPSVKTGCVCAARCREGRSIPSILPSRVSIHFQTSGCFTCFAGPPPPGNTFLILRCHVSEVKAILLLIRVGMFLLGWSGWKVEDYGGLGGEEVRRQTLTTRLRRCYTNVNIGFLLQSCENPIIKYLPETGMFLSPVCFLSVSGINKGGCREPAACQARTWKPLGPRSLNALAHLS